MFMFKRNQIIITVLVFMIAIAAYLNTKGVEENITPTLANSEEVATENIQEEEDFFDEEAIQELPPVGEEMEVVDQKGNTANETVSASKETTGEGALEAVITKKEAILDETSDNKTVNVDYFAEEKMLREQSRAAQIEQLTQYVANDKLDKESKSKAAESLLAIQNKIEKETSAEALLRAKGFKEVYVRIDDNGVDVVVNKSELSDAEIAQIEEIVHRKTGYNVGKIKITPLKDAPKTSEAK